MKNRRVLVEVRTGSDSDIPKIRKAYDFFDSIGISYSPRILSAHRTPAMMADEARKLAPDGYFVSIAAAGGSAHLPGMTASETILPIVGIPVTTTNLAGQDSLYSIIQMPDGIPVGCVGVGQAESAAILAAQIAYRNDPEVRNRIRTHRGLREKMLARLTGTPIVGIIKPAGIEVDTHKFNDMMKLMEAMGIQARTFEASPSDSAKAAILTDEIENEGAAAIIALGYLARDAATIDFPGRISGNTDIPIIALPVASGYVGSNRNIEGDIFRDLLLYRTPDGETSGYPVAGMGINRYTNAALYAAQIAGLHVPEIQKKVRSYRDGLAESVREKDERIRKEGIVPFLK